MDMIRMGFHGRPQAVIVLAAAIAIGTGGLPSSAVAQRDRHPPPGWHGDITRFHEHDWALWRDGRWAHERHDGRLGWWWVVGGTWYFYPWPVYPYPSPWYPPPIEITAPQTHDPLPPPTPYWYYCAASKSYYPYARTCPGGWKQVPAVPADVPASEAR
jgi:hypothetical protein